MNIYIITHSDKELEYYKGAFYSFKGANGKTKWPKECGAFLGPCGAYNLLSRLGLHAVVCTASNTSSIENESVVIVHSVTNKNGLGKDFYNQMKVKKCKVLLLGHINAYKDALQIKECRMIKMGNPNLVLGYKDALSRVKPMTPVRWQYAEIKAPAKNSKYEVTEIHGDFQCPKSATYYEPPNTPLVYSFDNLSYINLDLFSAFQSFLQGQDDLLYLINWRDRQFWLDEYSEDVAELLMSIHAIPHISPKKDLTQKAVIRHDVDCSRDTTYLDITEKHDIPCSYSILLDNNSEFWLKTLKPYDRVEQSYHYSTMGSFYKDVVMRKLNFPTHLRLKHYYNHVSGRSLLKQVRKAGKKGISTQFITRHYCTHYYPEYIDAYFYLEENHQTFKGSNSFNYSKVIRWGDIYFDSNQNTLARSPDAHFPFWMPYRVANAAEAGKISRTNESISLIEPEYEFVKRLLTKQYQYIATKNIVLNYHPAHARNDLFNREGNLKQLEDVINLLKLRNVKLTNIEELHKEDNE